ncbi:hypothetical protein CAPTEDRAFT_189509 [Capitella teleta]|uniref:G-protein coupled receptors family 1 profile domain-containing protein n=1 Tax=Capitella teleta TaxID=283909 RepID=R7TME8_CAPTE|nr:hypothetical protein CAPTEDRAFT_189509 [Capitella teleta]|eukprot:ELT92260.1 hypothetical protein CAPTEDRAFT_189509 [Capitella teleta]
MYVLGGDNFLRKAVTKEQANLMLSFLVKATDIAYVNLTLSLRRAANKPSSFFSFVLIRRSAGAYKQASCQRNNTNPQQPTMELMATAEDNSSAQLPTNNTIAEYHHSATYKVTTSIMFTGCTLVLLGLNALVVISFLFKRISRTQPNFYMFQLAIADGATGLLMPVNMFSTIFYSLSKSTRYCSFETMSAISCMMASTFCILGLTVDRMQALRYPLLYNSDMTVTRYVASTLWVWLIPISVYFVLPMVWLQELEDTPLKICYTLYIMKREFVAYILLPGIFLLFACVCIAYVPILKMAVTQSRAIRAVALDQNETKLKSQLQILKTATMVLLPYFAGWMPWAFITSLIVYNEHEYNFPGTTFKMMQYSAYPAIFTSGINPIIYAARMPEYRRAFKACLGCHGQVAPEGQP